MLQVTYLEEEVGEAEDEAGVDVHSGVDSGATKEVADTEVTTTEVVAAEEAAVEDIEVDVEVTAIHQDLR